MEREPRPERLAGLVSREPMWNNEESQWFLVRYCCPTIDATVTTFAYYAVVDTDPPAGSISSEHIQVR
jgi:hypothetical protein